MGYRTQRELADLLGVSRQTIIRLEKGDAKACGLWTIQRLAELLGLKWKALYCPAKQDIITCSPEESELVVAYRNLTIRQRAVLFLKVVTHGEDPESLHIS
ncbi:MAG: helix-turn-helix transcriptional regulator [Phycisphaerales bacterium]|jgi:DNA-binding XRE family transcriptional regulator|nr:helix-turn-helix transcriptional regulator [Phycisphaerales bacterium]